MSTATSSLNICCAARGSGPESAKTVNSWSGETDSRRLDARRAPIACPTASALVDQRNTVAENRPAIRLAAGDAAAGSAFVHESRDFDRINKRKCCDRVCDKDRICRHYPMWNAERISRRKQLALTPVECY